MAEQFNRWAEFRKAAAEWEADLLSELNKPKEQPMSIIAAGYTLDHLFESLKRKSAAVGLKLVTDRKNLEVVYGMPTTRVEDKSPDKVTLHVSHPGAATIRWVCRETGMTFANTVHPLEFDIRLKPNGDDYEKHRREVETYAADLLIGMIREVIKTA